MTHFFETSQFVAVELERAFRFFADPQNLPRITAPKSKAKIEHLRLISPENRPGLAGAGSEIEISMLILPPLPVRGRWLARIIDFEYGSYFRDIQVRGPFARFDHTHSFDFSGTGTIIHDAVEYDVGWGKLGSVANALLVRRALNEMFDYRQRATEKLLNME
jgi:ligand-binding SRPBCC domain-containing protein